MTDVEAVLFDLDQTLVHSGSLDGLRRARKWSEVYPLIPGISPQEGLVSLFAKLKGAGVRVAVVTSSPRPYCERMLKHCGFEPDVTVCYHDTRRHKPDPEPLLRALELMKVVPSRRVVAVGDTETDVMAAKSAGLVSVGVTWGIEDARQLERASPDHLVSEVPALEAILLG
jgi:phosphoglycolate phosphatase-like HAD superfamily hydrolase